MIIDLPVIRHTPSGPVCTTIPIDSAIVEIMHDFALGGVDESRMRFGVEVIQIRTHLLLTADEIKEVLASKDLAELGPPGIIFRRVVPDV